MRCGRRRCGGGELSRLTFFVTFGAHHGMTAMSVSIGLSNFARWAGLAGMTLASAIAVWGQPSKLIEVASVRPSLNATGDSNVDSVRGRLTATNITVRELIRLAYSARDYQVVQAPKWVDSDRFDVVAKSVSANSNGLEDEKALVRELLADRFRLATHRERKEMPVYLLVLGKGGPKLTPHNDAGIRTRGGCGRLVGRRVTADAIATMLSRQVEHEVVNRTGLAGEYDFQLDFTPDTVPCRTADSQGSPAADPSGPPSIYTAVQQQLGLKLESSKGPVELLVIDRVEKPSEN